MSDEQKLENLAKHIKVCTLCELHRSRTEPVPGEGPTHTEIMFIGEGPGAREDKLGRPFVGASGKFLDQLLEQAGASITYCEDEVGHKVSLHCMKALRAYLED